MTAERVEGEGARVGVLGFGTVGRSLVRLVQEQQARLKATAGLDLRITAVASRSISERVTDWVDPRTRLGEDLGALVRSADIDIVVELLGGIEPARDLVLSALAAGKHVVTANKLLLARHGDEILEVAAAHGRGVGIEASVAGGIPILRALRESFSGDQIEAVQGILNGTCNFILTEMEATGRSYAETLTEAQRLGLAEADPRNDVEGGDAACKLALLARMAFGRRIPVDAVARSGITGLRPCDFVYARLLGRTLRQLGIARELPGGQLLLSVRTHLVSAGSDFAKVLGPFNAVQVSTRNGGDFVLSGRGAGGDPTAVAVLGDVVEIARSGRRSEVPPLGWALNSDLALASDASFVAPFYLRFVVSDRPGIIAEISGILAAHRINIDAVFQAPFADKRALPFVVTLEPVPEADLRAALDLIEGLPFHAEPPLALPMTL